MTLGTLALAAATALGSPAGDLDPSFDNDGRRLLIDVTKVTDLVVQPDGKIVAVAETRGGQFQVVRLHPSGVRDEGFGPDGTAVADFGGHDRPKAVGLQPDGKIVVAGESKAPNEAPQVAVARFMPEGALDPTFDPGGLDGDGKKLFSSSQAGRFQYDARAVLVQPDGKIVLAGDASSPEQDIAVTRLTAGGAFDGTVFEPPRLGLLDMQDAALTPDGKIVVAATKFDPAKRSAIAITRFGPDGKLDKTLGGTGSATYESDQDQLPAAMVVQRDGKVVVAGSAGTTTDPSMVVTRFDNDGTPDRSFDGDGQASAGFDGQSAAAAAALQPDGKILVAGATLLPFDFAVARFTGDGRLDPGFGSGGRTSIDFGDKEGASALAVQPDGRVLVAGLRFRSAPRWRASCPTRLSQARSPHRRLSRAAPDGRRRSWARTAGTGCAAPVVRTSSSHSAETTALADAGAATSSVGARARTASPANRAATSSSVGGPGTAARAARRGTARGHAKRGGPCS